MKNNKLNKNFLNYLFFASLIIEVVIFYIFSKDKVNGYFPAQFDQGAYLLQSYEFAKKLQGSDPFNAIKNLLEYFFYPNPQGPLFTFLGGIFISIFSLPIRISALSVNLFLWIYLNFVFFNFNQSKSSVTRIFSLFFLGTLPLPFYMYGSLFDFRPDFAAFCLFGISCILLIQFITNSNKISFIRCLLSWWLLFLIRQLSFSYVNVIFFLLFLVFFTLDKLKATEITKTKSLALLWISYIALCIPFLYLSRHDIYTYYFIGHLKGSEGPIRAIQAHVTTLKSFLVYYPKQLFLFLVGPFLSLLILGISTFITLDTNRLKNLLKNHLIWVSLICFMAPLIVLTIVKSRSPVAGSVMIMPILLLSTQFLDSQNVKWRQVFNVLFIISLFAWPWRAFLNKNPYYQAPIYSEKKTTDLANMFLETINNIYMKRSTHKVTFCGLGAYPYFFDNSLSVFNYEQTRNLIKIENPFQNYFTHFDKQGILKRLESCDIVVYKKLLDEEIFPIHKSINLASNEITAELNRTFKLLKQSPKNNLILEGFTIWERVNLK